MASFSVFGSDLPPIALIVIHSLEESVLCSSVSTNCLRCFPPMFFCCSGDIVVHLLHGGRGWISRSEFISCSHPFQYFCSVLIQYSPEGICCDAAFKMMVRKIFSHFWKFVGIRLFCLVGPLSPYDIGSSFPSLS